MRYLAKMRTDRISKSSAKCKVRNAQWQGLLLLCVRRCELYIGTASYCRWLQPTETQTVDLTPSIENGILVLNLRESVTVGGINRGKRMSV